MDVERVFVGIRLGVESLDSELRTVGAVSATLNLSDEVRGALEQLGKCCVIELSVC